MVRSFQKEEARKNERKKRKEKKRKAKREKKRKEKKKKRKEKKEKRGNLDAAGRYSCCALGFGPQKEGRDPRRCKPTKPKQA